MNGLEIIPRSRIVALGTGTLPSNINQFQYMHLVYDCRLTSQMKHVLAYLALRYNFKKKQPTKMGTRRAANDLGMTRQTFKKHVSQLEEYGWVRVIKSKDTTKPHKHELLIGMEVPEVHWMDTLAKINQLELEQEREAANQNL